MDWSSPGAIFAQLSFPGVVLAMVITAAEYAVLLWIAGFPSRGRRAGRLVFGACVSFLTAAVLMAPAIALIQVPLQLALGRWMVASVATASQTILALPVILVSGLVQEPVKFLSALAGILPAALYAGRGPKRGAATAAELADCAAARAVLLGAVAGAGFGAFEAAVVLSAVFAATSPAAGGAGFAAMAPAVIERVSAVLFHLSTTGVVIYAWTRGVGKGLATLGGMALAHGVLNYLAVILAGPGLGATAVVELVVAVGSLALFILLARLVRRPGVRAGGGAAGVAALLLLVVVAVGLGGCGKPQPLALVAPWKAGEFSRLEMRNTETGATAGTWEMGVEAEQGSQGGQGAAGQGWVLTSRLVVPQGSQLSTVHVTGGDLQPTLLEIDARDEAGQGLATAKAVFAGGKVVVTARASGQDKPAVEIKLPAPPYFENEQFVITLRAMPLAGGWKATLNDIVSRSGSKAQVKVAVTGKETVTVPLGSFECWVVDLANLGQKAWIAVAAPNQLVQYENVGAKILSQLVEYRPGQ